VDGRADAGLGVGERGAERARVEAEAPGWRGGRGRRRGRLGLLVVVLLGGCCCCAVVELWIKEKRKKEEEEVEQEKRLRRKDDGSSCRRAVLKLPLRSERSEKKPKLSRRRRLLLSFSSFSLFKLTSPEPLRLSFMAEWILD